MKRTVIQLKDRQYETVKRLAASEGVSMAEVLRRAVDLLPGRSTIDREERKRRALAAAGRFNSGVGDIARRHDKYLAETYGEQDA